MDYKILIPSMGRCGSTLVADSIAAALNTKVHFVPDYHNAPDVKVLKTHAPYTGEPPYDYRAVYVWGNVGDIIHSLYEGRTSWGGDPRIGMQKHLQHLGIGLCEIGFFFELLREDKDKAFEYLIEEDHLRFGANCESWEYDLPKVLFVRYNEMCQYPIETFDAISDFIGTHILPPEIKPRQSSMSKLPQHLQQLIRETYPTWMLE